MGRIAVAAGIALCSAIVQAQNDTSTCLHLIDCYLEYRATQQLLGEFRARQVMEFWATDHYTWVYKTVLERAREIGNVVAKHKLIPPDRPPDVI